MISRFETVADVVGSCGLETASRSSSPAAWQAALDHCQYIPVSYAPEVLDFRFLYQEQAGESVFDISCVLLNQGKSIAVWPLCLSYSKESDEYSLSSFGRPVEPPIFVVGTSGSLRKKQINKCYALLEALCDEFKIKSWKSGESFANQTSPALSEWHIQGCRRGATLLLETELFVDLTLDTQTYRQTLRKSYKSLMTSAQKHWSVHLLREQNAEIWAEFKKLHVASAGKITRSEETWQAQLNAVADGHAMLVYLKNGTDGIVGGGFFPFTRDEAYYGVGAYDRTLFHKPLGHVVQFRAIEEMRNMGLKWYKIGKLAQKSDQPPPSAKELDISKFKEGFATHHLPRYAIHHECSGTI